MKFSLASAECRGDEQAEFLELYLREPVPLKDLVDALSCNLPMGIHIVRADLADDKAPKLMASVAGTTYLVKVPCAQILQTGFSAMKGRKRLFIRKHMARARAARASWMPKLSSPMCRLHMKGAC
mgnify:CR=1 FL=1